MDHTELAAETDRLKAAVDECFMACHRLESARAPSAERWEAWCRYDAAWRPYLEAMRAEAAEAVEAAERNEQR